MKNDPMKPRWIILLFPLLVMFLICETAWGAYQLKYTMEVYVDGSTTWVIEHRFLSETEYQRYSNLTYFIDDFVKNVTALVNMAGDKTERDMYVTNFKMVVSPFDRFVKYQFDWIGFAEVGASWIRMGDVFEVEGIFLYGEGILSITYSSEYVAESVSPKPSVESDGALIWFDVANFTTVKPEIFLKKRTLSIMDVLKENAPAIISLVVIVGSVSVSLWFLKFRKKKAVSPPVAIPPIFPGIQDDEQKVVNLLRAAGGSMYQSTIADQCGFSRSKISKLLKIMEEKSKIRREKKGREKVVTLLEELKDTR